METAVLGKALLCTIGAGGTALVGCYAGGLLTTEEVKGEPLSKDSNFSSTYNTDNQVGKNYGQYLVSAINASNEAGGKESYKQYEEDKKNDSIKEKLSTEFGDGKVTAAYDSNTGTALNKICESVYKKNISTDVDFETTTESEPKYKLTRDLLKYCSPLGQVPEIIKQNDSEYSSNTGSGEKIGKKGHNKKLVSTKAADKEKNKGFGEAQQKGFEGLGSSAVTDAYFSQFFKGDKEPKTLDKNIRDICDGAYKLQEPTGDGTATKDNPKLDDVAKYCSFSKLVSQS